MAAPRVFISMGTPYTPEHEQFRNELEAFLRDRCEVDPRIIGRNEYPDGSPLEHIRTVMRGSSGVIIVAYERKYLEIGTEKRGGKDEQKIENRVYTTPWNHIESAIAYSLELPLFIFCQKGLREEGLIESKNDWYVKHIDIKPGVFSDPDVSEPLRAWITRRVIPKFKKFNRFGNLMGRVKFGEMTPSEIWEFVVFVGAIFAAGAILGGLGGPLVGTIVEFFHNIHLLHF